MDAVPLCYKLFFVLSPDKVAAVDDSCKTLSMVVGWLVHFRMTLFIDFNVMSIPV